MSTANKNQSLQELQTIPGVGKACSLDLWNIGIHRIADLKNKNPLQLYNRLNQTTKKVHDICMLYVFRCAVYYATEQHHEKEKLNWWYWKNKTYNE